MTHDCAFRGVVGRNPVASINEYVGKRDNSSKRKNHSQLRDRPAALADPLQTDCAAHADDLCESRHNIRKSPRVGTVSIR